MKDIFKSTVLICLLTSLNANDGFDDDFDTSNEEIKIVKTQKNNKDYSIYGSLNSSSSYNTKSPSKVSSFKLSTNTNIDYTINDNYKLKSTIKAYKDFKTNINNDYDFDINTIYIQGELTNNIDIKIGRQIVVFGKSDNIRITDVLNPMDYTNPGLTDIKDLRLGRFMSKFDYTYNTWDLSAIILHENRYSNMPKKGSDYYIPKVFPSSPDNDIENTGFAFSASANLQGEDLALYFVNQYKDNTNYRTNMIGVAYNKVINSYLIKAEIAYFNNYDNKLISSKIDSLLGLEYNGFKDTSLSFELASKNDEIQYAFRVSKSYLNQTLDLSALANLYESNFDGGGFLRVWADYAINDDFSSSLGYIDYFGGNKQNFEIIKNEDRLFASLTYNF